MRETDLLRTPQRVLHIAPEPILRAKLESLRHLHYVTGDLMNPSVAVRFDITRLPLPDNSCDVVLCNHVLEHVPDDLGAMREMCRVLKPGGWAILNVPMDPNRPESLEDSTVTTPEARLRIYGQHDHVRIYGRDYFDRLRKAGFTVQIIPFGEKLGGQLTTRYRIGGNEQIVHCQKPTQ